MVETEKVLTSGSWKSRASVALDLPKDKQPTGRFPLQMIPFESVLEKATAAPSGTILLVVREDKPWKVTRISHMGFLVHDGDRLLIRHATKGWVNRVTDEELGHFLGRIQRHNASATWKVVGASLYAVEPRTQTAAAPDADTP